MWAGGRVRAAGSVHIGQEATRRSEMTASVEKQGRTGPLTIVTVTHEIEQAGRTVLVEEQDVVYRDATGALRVPDADPAPAGPEEWEIETSPTLLFRFSALTYNAHRIHYDLAYAEQEGYPGLVVHGPLQALMMGELMRRSGAPFAGQEFAYRLVAPMYGAQILAVSPDPEQIGVSARVTGNAGRVTATSTLRPSSG
jgi:3-methylfumaryl-CoA hydratase